MTVLHNRWRKKLFYSKCQGYVEDWQAIGVDRTLTMLEIEILVW